MRNPAKFTMKPVTLYGALLAAALALQVAPGARAANGGAIIVPLDHSVQIHVGGQARSVVVGNPGIADVTVVDSHTLFVSGRASGVTDVAVVDEDGRILLHSEVQVAPSSSSVVAVWHGVNRADYACTPKCETATKTTSTTSPGPSSPSSQQ
jgi:Flp pilus assembly secretin CpaC